MCALQRLWLCSVSRALPSASCALYRSCVAHGISFLLCCIAYILLSLSLPLAPSAFPLLHARALCLYLSFCLFLSLSLSLSLFSLSVALSHTHTNTGIPKRMRLWRRIRRQCTLLQDLQRGAFAVGVYDRIPGDGRQDSVSCEQVTQTVTQETET